MPEMETQREMVSLGQQNCARSLVLQCCQALNRDFLKPTSPLYHSVPQLRLFTDSSLKGLRAHMEEHMASWYVSPASKTQHINVLEMQAVWLALQAFAAYIKGNSIMLSTNKRTVTAYVNR